MQAEHLGQPEEAQELEEEADALSSGKFTIGERFIDLRPRIKQKAAAKKMP